MTFEWWTRVYKCSIHTAIDHDHICSETRSQSYLIFVIRTLNIAASPPSAAAGRQTKASIGQCTFGSRLAGAFMLKGQYPTIRFSFLLKPVHTIGVPGAGFSNLGYMLPWGTPMILWQTRLQNWCHFGFSFVSEGVWLGADTVNYFDISGTAQFKETEVKEAIILKQDVFHNN
jgi:hypothetical protein